MHYATLLENIKGVHRRISRACLRSGRDPNAVRLIAVTKTVAAGRILNAVESGLRDFGENKVQEAKEKISHLRPLTSGSNIVWHFIGHLQKNKVKSSVELFELIHSVDSLELAEMISVHAEKAGKIQDVLLQVKLSPEETKYGLDKEALPGLLHAMRGLKGIRPIGLMTMPPLFEGPEMTRPYFRQLRELRDSAEKAGFHLPELSMGMSHDFEVAIEEGATMVRVGTALFGERGAQ